MTMGQTSAPATQPLSAGAPPTRQQLEAELQALREQLIQMQRMTALGELLGVTTHEFNNILMTIINYAKIGLRNKDEATRDKALEKILSAGQRAAAVTHSILGMARNRTSAMEATDLPKLVEECLLLLEREMRKYRIAVECEIGPAPPAMANGNQIQQVLLNLLINARQAMPRGGRIVIGVRHEVADNMVELSVRDTGTGIPADKLRRIFEPYFSTKSGPDECGKGGAGLGLSLCRNIIESHRGRLRVESQVGKGTQFTIKLPTA